MYTAKDLKKEIQDQLENVGPKEIINPAIVTAQIIHRHRNCSETDDLFTFATFRFVRSRVGRSVRKNFIGQAPVQMELYPRLQPRYVVERDGVELAVPVDQITVTELLQKAEELEAESAEKAAHARDIRRYAMARLAQGEVA